MEKTKRQQNLLITHMVFHIVLFVIFISLSIWYFYPNITQVHEKKSQIRDLQSQIQALDVSGLTFDQYQNTLGNYKNGVTDNFVLKLLEKIDFNFFSTYLSNTGSGSYDQHIDRISQELSQVQDQVDQRNEEISTLLPLYGSSDTSTVSDFLFTSYLERVLNTFNLEYNGKLGIGELIPVTDQNKTNIGVDQDLSVSIYTTQLKLDIAGRKQDIIHFLHYFENVGSIELNEGDIQVYNDDFITRFGRDIVIQGEPRDIDYNIYLHQFGEIEYIKMSDYLDSSLFIRDLSNQSLQDFIKQTQSDERYEFEVGLNFYFKGLPKYKVREFITTFFQSYTAIGAKVQVELEKTEKIFQKTNGDRQYLRQLQSVSIWLDDVQKQVKDLSKQLANPDKIEFIYNQVLDLDEKMQRVQGLIDTRNTSDGL